MSKGYKDKSHKLNCPSNSLGKMAAKSSKETVISQSLSKMSVPSPGGTRPKGFSDKI